MHCLKVNELLEELQPCSLDTRGLKAELSEQLPAALEAKEPEDEQELEADDEPPNLGTGVTWAQQGGRDHGGGGGGSELEGTAQPPPPRLHPYPEPCGYSRPDRHYVMDNIIRQNQFYETQVIKQENESGYERRPLDMEPQQQAFHSELKKEMKQEAPSSNTPPQTSQLRTHRPRL